MKQKTTSERSVRKALFVGATAAFPSLATQEGGQKVGPSQQRKLQRTHVMLMGTERLKAGELPKCLGKFLGVENPYCSPGVTAHTVISGCT